MKELNRAINKVFRAFLGFWALGGKLLLICFTLLIIEDIFKEIVYVAVTQLQKMGIISTAPDLDYQTIGGRFLDVILIGFLLWLIYSFWKKNSRRAS